MSLIPLAKGICPNCGLNTLEVKMHPGVIRGLLGDTVIIGEGCMECGVVRSYEKFISRPWWHWLMLYSIVVAIVSAITIWAC